jgi:hypothetical protein
MKRWLVERGYDFRRPDLQMLIKQWKLAEQEDAFVLAPPSRIGISRHLLQYALLRATTYVASSNGDVCERGGFAGGGI